MRVIGSFFLLYLTLVQTQVVWKNCGDQMDPIQLKNLTIDPYPILAPGTVSISFTIDTLQNLTNPIKAVLSLKKKVLFTNIAVPCSQSGGPCIYNDLCLFCQNCRCPLPIGEHTLSLPMTIESRSWMLSGNYQGLIEIESLSGQRGCVKIDQISIKT